MSDFEPTAEQAEALRLFATGDDLVIEACAGSGKTTTLRLLAESTARRGRYTAFNKSLVTSAAQVMPPNLAVSTAHSMAFRAVGKRYVHRLNGQRMRSHDIARMLDIGPLHVRVGLASKVLQPGKLGSLVMRAMRNFAQSADETPLPRHLPYVEGIDIVGADGKREWRNNELVRAELATPMIRAWEDLSRTDGGLRFEHDHYFKVWALSHPKTAVDFILLDEAQDTAPVLAALLAEQTHCQRVAVGDGNQAIYGWRGAIDAMAMYPHAPRATLSRSFRFGPAIAETANLILARLGSTMVVEGEPSIPSTVEVLDNPRAILTRTNAGAMTAALRAIGQGRTPHIIGGGKELASFAKGVDDLRNDGWTSHPELSIFSSWEEVLAYVDQDPSGSELKLLVKLVTEFGTETILSTIANQAPEDRADLVVSTAHKAKGREWETVRLSDDFSLDEPDDEDLRLLYVAVTRARNSLDDSAVREVYSPADEEPEVEEGAA